MVMWLLHNNITEALERVCLAAQSFKVLQVDHSANCKFQQDVIF